MNIETLRFGNISYNQEHIIHFRDGMIGMSKLKDYILVESPAFPLILWLQSIQDHKVAFPLIEPYFFKQDYKVSMNDAERLSLNLQEGQKSKVMIILTIPQNLEAMTANFKAPIVFNIDQSLGTQVVLQDKTFEVRTPAYEMFNRATKALGSASESADETQWSPIRLGSEGERTAEGTAAVAI